MSVRETVKPSTPGGGAPCRPPRQRTTRGVNPPGESGVDASGSESSTQPRSASILRNTSSRMRFKSSSRSRMWLMALAASYITPRLDNERRSHSPSPTPPPRSSLSPSSASTRLTTVPWMTPSLWRASKLIRSASKPGLLPARAGPTKTIWVCPT